MVGKTGLGARNADGIAGVLVSGKPPLGNDEGAPRLLMHRMRGGVDDENMCPLPRSDQCRSHGPFGSLGETPRGRLALVIALDQFPRSLWRDTTVAYAQDIKASDLCLAALDNREWAGLATVWEKQFMLMSIGHAEGPEHLKCMARCLPLAVSLIYEAPEHLKGAYIMRTIRC